jgi:hypothetical protein
MPTPQPSANAEAAGDPAAECEQQRQKRGEHDQRCCGTRDENPEQMIGNFPPSQIVPRCGGQGFGTGHPPPVG